MAKTATKGTDIKSALGQLEDQLKVYFADKAPALPENIKELIVKFAPWLTIIGVVMGAFAFLALIGLGAFMVPLGTIGGMMSGQPFAGFGYIVTTVVTGLIVVMEAISISGLFKRAKSAWNIMFYVSLVNVVNNLVHFDLIGLVLGAVISWYFLFQVRSYYK